MLYAIKKINIFSYFRRKGLDFLPDSWYNNISRWNEWYKGHVTNFHKYRVYRGGGNYVTCNRVSLNMAKKVCEDIADFLLNDKLRITVGDDDTNAFVADVLEKSDFIFYGNQYQERKAATGTVAYVTSIVGTEFDEDGRVIDGSVKIDYYDADHIYPLVWTDDKVISAAFVKDAIYKRKRYALIQCHILQDGQYVITNDVIAANGAVLTRDEWPDVPEFSEVVAAYETGSATPQFAIDRLAIVNNIPNDYSCPMGVPIFVNSTGILRKLDLEYDSYASEFDLGRKRIFVSPEMLVDANGNNVFDPHDSVFYQLPEDYLSKEKPIYESNMALRVTEHEAAINQDLNLLSMRCGFGTQYYRFVRSGVATATQVMSENSDLYRTIKKHEIPLRAALTALIKSILELGVALGRDDIDKNAEIKIDFDDSIIEDSASERDQDRKDVEMGVMSAAEYRAKWYGETEDVAAAKIGEMKT